MSDLTDEERDEYDLLAAEAFDSAVEEYLERLDGAGRIYQLYYTIETANYFRQVARETFEIGAISEEHLRRLLDSIDHQEL